MSDFKQLVAFPFLQHILSECTTATDNGDIVLLLLLLLLLSLLCCLKGL